MSDSPKQEYLSQVLQMNPLEQPAEILDCRKQFLQPQTVSRSNFSANTDDRHIRADATGQINSLRKHFWSIKTDMIEQQLNDINISDYPELTFAIGRLRKIAALRKSFVQLKHRCVGHETFFKRFCRLVISSPAEAERLRQDPGSRNETDRSDFDLGLPEDNQAIARIVQQEFPELYALEKDWLDQLAATEKKSNAIALMVKTLYALIAVTAGISVILTLYLCL